MTHNLKSYFYKISFILLTLLFFHSGFSQSAQPAVNLQFSDWDKDGNGIITRTEFVDLFTTAYIDDWNLIDDAHLDDEDFYAASYDIWDKDGDQRLSEEEWLFGQENSYGGYTFNDIKAVDADGDGFIQPTEYYNVLDQTDYYPDLDVDKDNMISELELARMVFNDWDSDDSNFIEEDEYEEFDEYFVEF